MTANDLAQIRRRLAGAEEGTTEEKVLARSSYARDVRLLIETLEESGMTLAIQHINEIEDQLRELQRKEEPVPWPRPLPRMRQPKLNFEPHDGKMLAAGRDD